MGQLDTKNLGLMNAKNTAAATAVQQEYNNFLKANIIYSNAVTAEKKMLYAKDKAIFNMDPEDPSLDAQARANVAKSLSPKLIDSLGLNAVTKPDAVVAPKAGAPVVNITPPPAAIAMLKSSDTPERRAKFDETFGPGAAARALPLRK